VLRVLLRNVEAGGVFPADLMGLVRRRNPSASVVEIKQILLPQVPAVLASIGAAIEHEEAHRAELARSAAAERERLIQREERAQRRLQAFGLCPAGFAWHPENGGWRCNGGSHFVPHMPRN
jgi:hypothetical protein